MGYVHDNLKGDSSANAGPFIVFGLPRSRTAWLSRFLTYGDHVCGHDQLRYMRSLDDVKAWFSQPYIGSAETAGATWWRLIPQVAPNAQIVVVRRNPADVIESLMRLPGCGFERESLSKAIYRMDRKLDQIERRLPNVLSVRFEELARESVCARVFEHCLPYPHDHDHWAALDQVNVQCDMRAMVRYVAANAQALGKLAAIARYEILTAMANQAPGELEGMTFQAEDFDTWISDARLLFDRHLILVGEAPGDWQKKNLAMMRGLYQAGMMQITTARSNGRMFGYLMTMLSPSLTGEGVLSAYNTTFYASQEVPGLGTKIQRAAIDMLKARGVDEVFFEAGQRGSGPRLGTLYKRLGAQEHGQVYRLKLVA